MSLIGKRITVSGADFSDIKLDFETFVLDRIEITSQPAITTYHLQDAFDPTGMKVMAYYIGDISGKETYRNITDYTWDPADAFTVVGPQVITVSYTDADITKTATLTVTVLGETAYDISSNITNGTMTGATTLVEGNTATVTIIPNTGYSLPDTITVTNAQYTYDSTTGEVVLSNGTGNVTVTAVCEGEIPATENLTFSIGAYTWDTSTYGPNTKIRATYFGNLHAGDVISMSPDAKAGTQYQYVFSPLAGTSGHQSADNTVRQVWADAGVQVTGMPNAHYEDVPVTIPLDGRVAVTIKDNNAATTNISESELAKIFQITWIDPTDPTNDPISKP